MYVSYVYIMSYAIKLHVIKLHVNPRHSYQRCSQSIPDASLDTLSRYKPSHGRPAGVHHRTSGKRKTWDSSRGMALCQAQKVLPRYLISSLGSFGCGWHRLMPSNKACTTLGLHASAPLRIQA